MIERHQTLLAVSFTRWPGEHRRWAAHELSKRTSFEVKLGDGHDVEWTWFSLWPTVLAGPARACSSCASRFHLAKGADKRASTKVEASVFGCFVCAASQRAHWWRVTFCLLGLAAAAGGDVLLDWRAELVEQVVTAKEMCVGQAAARDAVVLYCRRVLS